jgi:hypothetical protein
MHFNMAPLNVIPADDPRVGNVYPVRGGHGMKKKHMFVLFHISESQQLGFLYVINKEGELVGVTQYGLHYIRELTPIAFVDGLEDLEFNMRSI